VGFFICVLLIQFLDFYKYIPFILQKVFKVFDIEEIKGFVMKYRQIWVSEFYFEIAKSDFSFFFFGFRDVKEIIDLNLF